MTQAVTKYQPYPKYKSSGIEWLGDIPFNWGIKPFKYLCEYYADYGLNIEAEYYRSQGIRFIRTGDIDDEGRLANEGVYLDRELVPQKYLLSKGDILLSRSGTIGRSYVHEDSIEESTYAGYLVRFHPYAILLSFHFAYYYFHSLPFFDWIKTQLIETTIGNVNGNKYANIPIIAPSLKEQNLISEFLDRETAKIDAVIVKKQQLIKQLREKRQAYITHSVTKGLNPNGRLRPSGIKWLGDIPEGWDVKRLKYLSNTRVSNVDKKSEDDIAVRLCNYIDVYKNEFITENLDFMKATATTGQIDAFELKTGDVIITKDSETPDDIGVPAFVKLSKTDKLVCGYHLAIITPNTSILSGYYLFRLLQSKYYRSYFEVHSNGVTRFGLDTYSIFNADIILPPFSEQLKICEFLDKEIAKIDQIITQVVEQIEKLQEYRQALITNAVTGKMRVSHSEV